MKKCPRCGEEYEDDSVLFCRNDGQRLDRPSEGGAEQGDPLIGRVLAGRYRLMAKLGQGGMGAVYRGEHVKMNRLTAIKILAPELANNAEFVARFQREAEMASHINHPNAVIIYDFGEAEDGIVYLAMEFLEGRPLSSIIKRDGPLPLPRVARIIRQAAEALNAAHQLGIVHRDFKPDNVIICQRTGQEVVKVLDFGIAKQIRVDPKHEALTQTGFVLGTPQYMSPEQVLGEQLDARSDLYSLALVAYEMLTCALPFEGASPQSQMVKRLLEPPKPLRLVRPQLAIPPAVEQTIMRALARYPHQRHPSTLEFAFELERQALQAPPTSQPIAHAPSIGSQPRLTPQAVPSGPMPQPPSMPTPPQLTPIPQPKPATNKALIIVLIVVLALAMLMGGCFFILALIGSSQEGYGGWPRPLPIRTIEAAGGRLPSGLSSLCQPAHRGAGRFYGPLYDSIRVSCAQESALELRRCKIDAFFEHGPEELPI
jgi:serine/threonine-protein kinase